MKILLYCRKERQDEFVKMRAYRNIRKSLEKANISIADQEDEVFDIAHFVGLDDLGMIKKIHHAGKPIIITCFSENIEVISPATYDNLIIPSDMIEALNYADMVLATTETTKVFLKNAGVFSPIYVLNPGVDVDSFQNGNELEKNSFLNYAGLNKGRRYVLGLVDFRNYHDVFMYYRLAKKYPEIEFFALGKNIKSVFLPSKVKNLMRNELRNLHYHNMLYEDIYKSALLNCDCFLLSKEYNLSSQTLLEAMINKKLVIGFKNNVTLERLIDEKTGYIAKDYEHLDGLFDLYVKKQLKDTSEEAFLSAKDQTLEKVGIELIKIYEMIANHVK